MKRRTFLKSVPLIFVPRISRAQAFTFFDPQIYARRKNAEYWPTSGLISAWRMEDGAGTTVTDSVGGYNGSFAGGTNPQWVAGKFGGGLYFQVASSNYVTMGSHDDLRPASLTVCGWWSPGAVEGTVRSVIDCQNGGTGGWVMNLNQNGSNGAAAGGMVAFYFYSNGSWIPVYTTGSVLTQYVWCHLAVTYTSGGTALLYINGSTSGTTGGSVPSGISYNSNTFTLGGESGGQQSFGTLDEVFLYNRSLSSSEIAQIIAGPV